MCFYFYLLFLVRHRTDRLGGRSRPILSVSPLCISIYVFVFLFVFFFVDRERVRYRSQTREMPILSVSCLCIHLCLCLCICLFSFSSLTGKRSDREQTEAGGRSRPILSVSRPTTVTFTTCCSRNKNRSRSSYIPSGSGILPWEE